MGGKLGEVGHGHDGLAKERRQGRGFVERVGVGLVGLLQWAVGLLQWVVGLLQWLVVEGIVFASGAITNCRWGHQLLVAWAAGCGIFELCLRCLSYRHLLTLYLLTITLYSPATYGGLVGSVALMVLITLSACCRVCIIPAILPSCFAVVDHTEAVELFFYLVRELIPSLAPSIWAAYQIERILRVCFVKHRAIAAARANIEAELAVVLKILDNTFPPQILSMLLSAKQPYISGMGTILVADLKGSCKLGGLTARSAHTFTIDPDLHTDILSRSTVTNSLRLLRLLRLLTNRQDGRCRPHSSSTC
jgi:hypothetical protein